MTALAEALLAAQRQAIGALSKHYVAGMLDVGELCEHLDAMGCKDDVDQGQSKVIEQLKAGTYNPDEWTVPF